MSSVLARQRRLRLEARDRIVHAATDDMERPTQFAPDCGDSGREAVYDERGRKIALLSASDDNDMEACSEEFARAILKG